MLRLIHTVSLRTESKSCKEARKGRAAALFRQPEAIHLLTLSSPQAQPRRKHPLSADLIVSWAVPRADGAWAQVCHLVLVGEKTAGHPTWLFMRPVKGQSLPVLGRSLLPSHLLVQVLGETQKGPLWAGFGSVAALRDTLKLGTAVVNLFAVIWLMILTNLMTPVSGNPAASPSSCKPTSGRNRNLAALVLPQLGL